MTASHGIFSFPFFSATRNEQPSSGKANLIPTKPAMTQIPLFNNFNKMKRKRSDSSPVSPRLDISLSKRRTETLSHVHIPSLDSERRAKSAQGSQKNGVDVLGQATMAPSEKSSVGWEALSDSVQNQNQPTHGRLTDSGSPEHNKNAGKNAASTTSISALRQAIEAQFGLEILLKHKELRLIDQEFARCQAALEQLRRCQVIPFPAMSSDLEAMQAASSGTGPVFDDRASHAAPWGVANGPYSRHYERWLIPDSAFDERIVDTVQPPSYGGKYVPDRATRGSKSDGVTFGSNSRSQRGSNNARLKALPHGYPEPKEEKGPMIVKRGSDGKMVKLVCLDCRRSNFNSAQGFINHCRIAHSRQFLSHDAAIEASGEEIEADAEGTVGEVTHGSQATASSALVHPLIRSSAQLARAPTTEQSTSSSLKRKRSPVIISATGQRSIASSVPADTSTPPQLKIPAPTAEADSTPFTPSPQTPHLSALLARIGRGGNLDELVNQARARPDLDLSFSSDEEDDGEEAMQVAAGTTSAPQSRSTRGVLRAGALLARRSKSSTPPKQPVVQHAFSRGAQKPPYLSNINAHEAYPSPYHLDGAQEDHDVAMPDSNTPFNLSPNTIEAHTAPSLVSDDGDYENTHSESESPSPAEADHDDDHYIHAEVMDHDDIELGEGSSADHHLALGAKPHGPPSRGRTSAMRPPMDIHHGEPEQRHVSFANAEELERHGLKTKNRE